VIEIIDDDPIIANIHSSFLNATAMILTIDTEIFYHV